MKSNLEGPELDCESPNALVGTEELVLPDALRAALML
jgi:hypothetical protein